MSSAVPAPQRIELSPAVRAILEADTSKSQLLRHFLRFSDAIIAPDPAGIDRVVTHDARFHELEAIGYPRGPEGFKIFRRQVNAAIPDEHIFVTAVRFEGDDIIEADLDISATHTGEELWVYPRWGGRFASTSMPAADLLMARWPNAGTKPTSRISSVSSLDPLSKTFPHEESKISGSEFTDEGKTYSAVQSAIRLAQSSSWLPR